MRVNNPRLVMKLISATMLLNYMTVFANQMPADRPNIVFILVDDLGWADVNVYDPLNRGFYETPNIDALAAQGMRFTNAYANPTCTPSRAALMSGQYYPRQPVYDVYTQPPGTEMIPAANTDDLPEDKITIAEALKSGGYQNGFMGKWHIGRSPRHGPLEQGFDLNIGGYNMGNPGEWEGEFFQPNNNKYISDAREGEFLTDYLTRKAVEYIIEKKDETFYLHLSYYAVHIPLQAPQNLVKKYEKKQGSGGHDNPTYAAMIESVDTGIGKVISTLKDLGLDQNTLVIFYSDNGGFGGYSSFGEAYESSDITDNSPLRNGKNSIYEGGIRVPLIVRWPGVINPGTVCHEPVIHIDMYPTLLEATGVKKPENYILDGVSLLPLLQDPDEQLGREALYWHFPGYTEAGFEGGPQTVIRSGDWKLMRRYENGKPMELYNLASDLGERTNEAASHSDVVIKLENLMDEWLYKMKAPMPYYFEEMWGMRDENERLKKLVDEQQKLIEQLQKKK